MHIIDTILFLLSIFFFRASKAVTNKLTREKLSKASIRFNKFLWYLRDTEIREIFRFFQKWFLWIALCSLAILLVFSWFKIKISPAIATVLLNGFPFSFILFCSIWWMRNHKNEIKDMFSKQNIFFTILFVLSPLAMLLLEKISGVPFYESIKNDPSFPFPKGISSNLLAGILTFLTIFIFIILPYLIAIPVYLCLYLPLKGYILFLRIVSEKISKDLLLWSVLLLDVIYGIWRIWYQ